MRRNGWAAGREETHIGWLAAKGSRVAARSFLVLELPGLRTAGLEYSRSHPGATIDLVLSLGADGPDTGARKVRAFCLARGLGAGGDEAMIAAFRRDRVEIGTIERNADGSVWFGTLDFVARELPDARLVPLMQFLRDAELNVGWLRVEEGVSYLRAEIADEEHPDRVLDAAHRFLSRSGIDADAAIEQASSKDAGPWMELLLRTLDRHRATKG